MIGVERGQIRQFKPSCHPTHLPPVVIKYVPSVSIIIFSNSSNRKFNTNFFLKIGCALGIVSSTLRSIHWDWSVSPRGSSLFSVGSAQMDPLDGCKRVQSHMQFPVQNWNALFLGFSKQNTGVSFEWTCCLGLCHVPITQPITQVKRMLCASLPHKTCRICIGKSDFLETIGELLLQRGGWWINCRQANPQNSTHTPSLQEDVCTAGIKLIPSLGKNIGSP